MAQSGKMANTAAPPFATKDGKPAGQGQTAGGGHDFVSDKQGDATASGGRDFTKESRPQSEAKPEVVVNPQEIPAGGKILMADPGPVSAKVSGTAQHVQKAPFKGLKG
jgi:hypothetical protein